MLTEPPAVAQARRQGKRDLIAQMTYWWSAAVWASVAGLWLGWAWLDAVAEAMLVVCRGWAVAYAAVLASA